MMEEKRTKPLWLLLLGSRVVSILRLMEDGEHANPVFRFLTIEQDERRAGDQDFKDVEGGQVLRSERKRGQIRFDEMIDPIERLRCRLESKAVGTPA